MGGVLMQKRGETNNCWTPSHTNFKKYQLVASRRLTSTGSTANFPRSNNNCRQSTTKQRRPLLERKEHVAPQRLPWVRLVEYSQ